MRRSLIDLNEVTAGLVAKYLTDPLSADEDLCRCSLRTKLVGDGCQHCNPELHADLSADEAEHGVCAMGDLPELSDSQMAEGHLTEERR